MRITLDAGSTLGTFTQPGSIEVLAEIAAQHRGVKKSMVGEIVRWKLHVAPKLTDNLIAEVCHYLMIPREAWPPLVPSGFTAYPYAGDVLATMAKLAPLTVISNVSVLTGPDRMSALDDQLGRHLTAIYPSYEIATRNPTHAAGSSRHPPGAGVSDIVHIGDRIPEDIDGALHAGCRAAILTNTRGIDVPDYYLHADARVAVVPDLQAALPVLYELARP